MNYTIFMEIGQLRDWLDDMVADGPSIFVPAWSMDLRAFMRFVEKLRCVEADYLLTLRLGSEN